MLAGSGESPRQVPHASCGGALALILSRAQKRASVLRCVSLVNEKCIAYTFPSFNNELNCSVYT